MESLPVELLDQIVCFCDHASRKNLRRTSKAFEDRATPSVFEHHFTAMFDGSLFAFENIASSRLAKHVKRLTYFNDTLPKYNKKQYVASVDFRPEFHTFREQRKEEFPDEVRDVAAHASADVFSRAYSAWEALPRHHLTKKELDQGWKEWQKLCKEQKRWGKDDQDQRFQSAFQKLPNLCEVEVVRAMFENPCTSEWPVWKRLRRSMLLGPDDWKEHMSPDEQTLDFGMVLETATLCLLEAVAQRNRERAVGVQPVSVIRIQNDLTHPLSLTANWTNSLYGTAPETRQWAKSLDGPLPLADAFRQLSTFTVRMEDSGEMTTSAQLAAVRAQLHHFLSVAPNLRRLTLILDGDLTMARFDEDLEDWGGEEPGINIFDSQSTLWPEIEHVSLSVNCNTDKMLRLLRLHSSTLRSLEIRNSTFDDVPSLLEQIPKILALDHV